MKSNVQILKVLADCNRQRILQLLRERELFVCQLMAVLGLSQPLVSRNLSLLEQAGLIVARREGKQMYYRLARNLPPLAERVMDALAVEWRVSPLPRADLEALAQLHQRFADAGGVCDMAAVRRYLAFQQQNPKTNPNQED